MSTRLHALSKELHAAGFVTRWSEMAGPAAPSQQPLQQSQASTIFDDDWLFDISRKPSAQPGEDQMHGEPLSESYLHGLAPEAGAGAAAASASTDEIPSTSQRFWFSNMLPPSSAPSADVEPAATSETPAACHDPPRPPGQEAAVPPIRASFAQASSNDASWWKSAADADQQHAFQEQSELSAKVGSMQVGPRSEGPSRLPLTNPQLKAARQELTLQHVMPVVDGHSGE